MGDVLIWVGIVVGVALAILFKFRPDLVGGRTADAKTVKTAKTRHWFHILMVVLTGGLWIIPWFLLSMRTKRKRHEQLVSAVDQLGQTKPTDSGDRPA